MPDESFNHETPKTSVSINLDSELVAKAKHAGVDISKVAEAAIEIAVTDRMKIIEVEMQAEIEACNAYILKHGNPADMAREHYAETADSKNAI